MALHWKKNLPVLQLQTDCLGSKCPVSWKRKTCFEASAFAIISRSFFHQNIFRILLTKKINLSKQKYIISGTRNVTVAVVILSVAYYIASQRAKFTIEFTTVARAKPEVCVEFFKNEKQKNLKWNFIHSCELVTFQVCWHGMESKKVKPWNPPTPIYNAKQQSDFLLYSR